MLIQAFNQPSTSTSTHTITNCQPNSKEGLKALSGFLGILHQRWQSFDPLCLLQLNIPERARTIYDLISEVFRSHWWGEHFIYLLFRSYAMTWMIVSRWKVVPLYSPCVFPLPLWNRMVYYSGWTFESTRTKIYALLCIDQILDRIGVNFHQREIWSQTITGSSWSVSWDSTWSTWKIAQSTYTEGRG